MTNFEANMKCTSKCHLEEVIIHVKFKRKWEKACVKLNLMQGKEDSLCS